MLLELIVYISLLLSSLFVISRYIARYRRPLSPFSPVQDKLLAGLCYGLVGALLMYAHTVLSGDVADPRQIVIMLSFFYGGWIPALVSSAFLLLIRLIMLPESSALIFLLSEICTLAITQIVLKLPIARSKQWYVLTAAVMTETYMLLWLRGSFTHFMDEENLHFPLTFMLGAVFSYHILESLRRTLQNAAIDTLLQQSLDRFSHDLLGVKNVNEMEHRLVMEVQEVTGNPSVSLLEVDRNHDFIVKTGHADLHVKWIEQIAKLLHTPFPPCKIIDTPYGYLIKIAEFRDKGYLLCIRKATPLTIPVTVWLKTISRYASSLYDNFRVIEDLTRETAQLGSHPVAPPWLLRLLFNLSENERKSLSLDLHDGALQEQIIWYRKLEALSSDPSAPAELREQLHPITQGLLDVIHQIRITCSELMPPMLKEAGLVSSLEHLFESKQLRTNYAVDFDASDFHHSLDDDELIGMYRIVQELLANAEKHSQATRVQIALSSFPDRIQLIYEDNGVGIYSNELINSVHNSGIFGMRERVRSLEGTIELKALPNQGTTMLISIPSAYRHALRQAT
jgi:signal transduction histidine kinase